MKHQILTSVLKERGETPEEFARRADLEIHVVHSILESNCCITYEIAQALESATQIPQILWHNK